MAAGYFFFGVPQLDLWGSPFWVRFFAYVTVFFFFFFFGLFVCFFVCFCFFYVNIEVVTFRLHGWCMLGVFSLPVFTRLGHECQNRFSPCDAMHVCTDLTSVYTLIRRSLGGIESEPMLTPNEKSPLPEKSPQRRIEPMTLQDSEPNTLPTSYSGPLAARYAIAYHRVERVGWLLACLTSQQHASVSQGRIYSDNFMCCHTEIKVTDQTF